MPCIIPSFYYLYHNKFFAKRTYSKYPPWHQPMVPGFISLLEVASCERRRRLSLQLIILFTVTFVKASDF